MEADLKRHRPTCTARRAAPRRGLLGEFGPDTPVSRAGALDAAVDVMANDERQDDRMPAHDAVLPVFGRQVQGPRNFPGSYVS
jgi:hypothetical protein